MKKTITKIALAAGLMSAFVLSAQESSQNKTFFKSGMTTPVNHRVQASVSTNTTSCAADTIVYPYLKELTLTAPNDSFFVDAMVGSVRTASQAYPSTGTVQVKGVQFWGAAYSTSTNPQTLQVMAYLYNVGANNAPTTKIDSAIGTITQAYDFYEIMFATPVTVTGNFAVAVRSFVNDTLAVVTNNAGNVWSTNYGEGLGWRRFGSGTWNSALSFFGQDLEYMIFPIVTHTLTSSFTSSATTACQGGSLTFTNTTTGTVADRAFNLYVFDDYWAFAPADSTYTWDYGTGTSVNAMNGSHTFANAGTFTVTLSSELVGYYSTCTDVASTVVTINPTYTMNIAASICPGDNYTFGTQTLTTGGIYSEPFTTINGCDSTVNLTLTVNPVYNQTMNATICTGDVYVLGTQTLTATGNYSETFTSVQYGCDSTVNVNLTVESLDLTTTTLGETITAAAGLSYMWIDCSNNSVIAGETGQSFTATANGNYAAIVSSANCSDTTACVMITTVGIKNVKASDVRVFPNPAKDQVNIQFGNNVAKLVSVYNTLGELVLEMKPVDNLTTISLSGAKGVYSIRISYDDRTEVIRLIKE